MSLGWTKQKNPKKLYQLILRAQVRQNLSNQAIARRWRWRLWGAAEILRGWQHREDRPERGEAKLPLTWAAPEVESGQRYTNCQGNINGRGGDRSRSAGFGEPANRRALKRVGRHRGRGFEVESDFKSDGWVGGWAWQAVEQSEGKHGCSFEQLKRDKQWTNVRGYNLKGK